MREFKTGLNAEKFCYFFDASEKLLSLIRFAIDVYALYNRLNASRLAQFRKTMKTCEAVKYIAQLFL